MPAWFRRLFNVGCAGCQVGNESSELIEILVVHRSQTDRAGLVRNQGNIADVGIANAAQRKPVTDQYIVTIAEETALLKAGNLGALGRRPVETVTIGTLSFIVEGLVVVGFPAAAAGDTEFRKQPVGEDSTQTTVFIVASTAVIRVLLAAVNCPVQVLESCVPANLPEPL